MKKSFVLCLAIIMCLFAVTGSIAYFTDSITVQGEVKSGNLDIEQFEFERKTENNAVTLVTYRQNQAIYPSVGAVSHLENQAYSYSTTDNEDKPVTGTLEACLMDSSLHGFVDKIVVVKNNGSLPTYVRTFVAVPTAFAQAVHLDWNLDTSADPTGWVLNGSFPATITYNKDEHNINGVDYTVWYATYYTPLAAKNDDNNDDVAPPSLLGFYLDSQVNHNGNNYILNTDSGIVELGSSSDLKILVATQAAQVIPDGIGDESHMEAEQALTETYDINLPEGVTIRHPWMPE